MTVTQRTIASDLSLAADIIGGKPWGAAKGKPRIYMPSRRDTKVFFEFSDACYPDGEDFAAMQHLPCEPAIHSLGGASLRIYIDDCGQHPNWYASQKQKIRANSNTKQAGLALAALDCDDEQLARDIMAAEEFDADCIDEVAGHLLNGRTSEARAALCASVATEA